ncbi:MAG: TRAM domain-containing protein [Candidatus Planktophila sp.]|jgi:tRNA/tmRNA/rRNA uracil-C5-methylase (TrmA/RlmC/RlmD family)
MTSNGSNQGNSVQRVEIAVEDRITVAIEKIAHGGHFIARHLGAVIFVRHAIPGEEVEIEITSTGSSFNRGDVVNVVKASPDRVSAPCQFAHRQGCGGCDFQHISLERQRSLKSEVISEQFSRIAKMDLAVEVEEVSAPLGYRSRFAAVTTRNGDLGFKQSRSTKIVPVSDCRVLQPELKYQELSNRKWKPGMQVEAAISTMGERTIATGYVEDQFPVRISEGPDIAKYEVNSFTLEVSQKSFWQSHYLAPTILSQVVLDYAQPKAGDQVLDLYGGVGLFTSQFLKHIGESGRVDLVEGSKSATADASRNFANFPNVAIHTGDVAKLLPRFAKADIVVLDPPREGAGKEVITTMGGLKASRIIYVACDPAALARDTTYLQEQGYKLQNIRAFDLFPMTHHIESVALFTRSKVS